MNNRFDELLGRIHSIEDLGTVDLVVGLDPGKRMTGTFLVMLEPVLGIVVADRLYNTDLKELIWELDSISEVVMEDFRIYPWMLQALRWDYLEEVRLIGAVEEICRVKNIDLVLVTPSQSKRLVEDHELLALGTAFRNRHVSDGARAFWAATLYEVEEKPKRG